MLVTARMEPIQIYDSDGNTLFGVKYSCGSCGVILSLGIDPFAQAEEIANELLEPREKN
jgi:hypothetical protein